MLQRVYERASKQDYLSKLVVATDDQRIFDHVLSFHGEALMTANHHPSGTDRCWDALQQLQTPYQYVINVQGDEPLIAPEQIDELAALVEDGSVELATQMIPVDCSDLLFNEGEAKIVLNENSEAIYFSRAAMPFLNKVKREEWHLHHTYYSQVGMYAYRRDILERITQLPVSTIRKSRIAWNNFDGWKMDTK